MPDVNTPITGAESSITIAVNGASQPLSAQIDGFSVTQLSSTMTHKPIGTMSVKRAVDFEGYEIRVTVKKANSVASDAMSLIEESARAGLPYVVTLTTTERYRDLTSERWLYTDLTMVQGSTSVKRGENNSCEYTFTTGERRVRL